MIHKLILKNFKSIKHETFEFNNFDLIVGANNSGKSTVLQALAIWQYCIDQFILSKRTKSKRTKGKNGIQIVLPNFTALPLPEFNLLWTEKTNQEKDNPVIYIEIDVYWKNQASPKSNLCVMLRYQSPQAIYANPKCDWENFSIICNQSNFPKIVYVPPFSALDPHERWLDDGNVKQQIGKAQPGSVLRNLLYRVIDNNTVLPKVNGNWQEIFKKVKDWFGVELSLPVYTKGVSTEIISQYQNSLPLQVIKINNII